MLCTSMFFFYTLFLILTRLISRFDLVLRNIGHSAVVLIMPTLNGPTCSMYVAARTSCTTGTGLVSQWTSSWPWLVSWYRHLSLSRTHTIAKSILVCCMSSMTCRGRWWTRCLWVQSIANRLHRMDSTVAVFVVVLVAAWRVAGQVWFQAAYAAAIVLWLHNRKSVINCHAWQRRLPWTLMGQSTRAQFTNNLTRSRNNPKFRDRIRHLRWLLWTSLQTCIGQLTQLLSNEINSFKVNFVYILFEKILWTPLTFFPFLLA